MIEALGSSHKLVPGRYSPSAPSSNSLRYIYSTVAVQECVSTSQCIATKRRTLAHTLLLPHAAAVHSMLHVAGSRQSESSGLRWRPTQQKAQKHMQAETKNRQNRPRRGTDRTPTSAPHSPWWTRPAARAAPGGRSAPRCPRPRPRSRRAPRTRHRLPSVGGGGFKSGRCHLLK